MYVVPVVDGNSAQGSVGGGIASGDYFGFSDSGSVLSLNGSEVNDNIAPNAGGGGIQNLLGTATINNSRVDGNTSLNGGGIASGNAGGTGTAVLKLNNSQVNGNTATAPVPQPGPEGGPPIAAGGIANGSVAELNNTQVDDNTATTTSGGGIVNGQGPPGSAPTTLTLNNSRVNNNRAGGFGGRIANGLPSLASLGLPSPPGGAVTLHGSQVTGNTAAHGGGIFNRGAKGTLSNAAVTGNVIDNCEPLNSIAGCTG